MSEILIKNLNFTDVLPVWENKLWPGRDSPIEPMSAMIWPTDTSQTEYDSSIFYSYEASFWGAFHGNKLIAVNSGHQTSPAEFRSRGIWVDSNYRRQGIAQILLGLADDCAIKLGCSMIWSMPRISALGAYEKHGFVTQGKAFKTETSDQNIYVRKALRY